MGDNIVLDLKLILMIDVITSYGVCTNIYMCTSLVERDIASLQVVTGRPLQMGDIAIIDFKAMRADTDELITGSQQRGMRLDTELGDRALGLAGGCCAALNSAPGSTSVAGSCRPAETLYL